MPFLRFLMLFWVSPTIVLNACKVKKFHVVLSPNFLLLNENNIFGRTFSIRKVKSQHCTPLYEHHQQKFNKIQQKLNICFVIFVTFRQARSNVELTVPKQIAFRAQTLFKNTDQL